CGILLIVASMPFFLKMPASLASVSGAKPVQPLMPIATLASCAMAVVMSAAANRSDAAPAAHALKSMLTSPGDEPAMPGGNSVHYLPVICRPVSASQNPGREPPARPRVRLAVRNGEEAKEAANGHGRSRRRRRSDRTDAGQSARAARRAATHHRSAQRAGAT